MTKKKTSTPARPRSLKVKPYKNFRLSKRIYHKKPQLSTSRSLLKSSLKILRRNWRPFLGIVTVYFLLTIFMVQRLGIEGGISSAKEEISGLLSGNTLLTSLTILGYLVSTTGATTSQSASLYQTLFLLATSLAFIWGLRQVHAGHKITTKQAFYSGMYPLIPFVLVFLVIILQLTPMLAGSWLNNIVAANGIAATSAEKALWVVFAILLALLSLYMVTSSVFALYISTLPDMTPMKALRSARELVRHRRAVVARRLLFLPVALVLALIIIMLPVIIYITPIAEWVFFVLSTGSLAVVHSYLYSLYRDLL